MIDILPIASYVIERSDCSITNLKLNKLLYYVYGVNLAINAEDEISEGPEAWTYGPVFPTVYHQYKKYGQRPIERPEQTGANIPQRSTIAKICDRVLEHYLPMKDFELVILTHKDTSPWDKTFDGSHYKTIPDTDIKDYFEREIIRA